LGNVIKDHLDDALIKEVAKRATWLGNDETHYVRKWVDKDISDLKSLVRIAMNFVDSVLEAERHISDMPEPQKPGAIK
jgi:hypothetical protein